MFFLYIDTDSDTTQCDNESESDESSMYGTIPFPPKTSRRNRESSKRENQKPKRKCPKPKPQVQRRTSARVAKKTQILEQGKFIFILYHVLSL